MNFKKIISAVGAAAVLCSSMAAFADTTNYTLLTTDRETRVEVNNQSVDNLGTVMSKLSGWGYHYAARDGDTSKHSDLKVNSGGIKLIGATGAQTTTGAAYITYTPSDTVESGRFYSFTVQATSTGSYDLSDADGRYVAIGLGSDSTQTVVYKLADTEEHKVYIRYDNTTAKLYVDGIYKTSTSVSNAAYLYIKTPGDGNRAANVQISSFTSGEANKEVPYTVKESQQFEVEDNASESITAAVLEAKINPAQSSEYGLRVTPKAHTSQNADLNTQISGNTTVVFGIYVSGIEGKSSGLKTDEELAKAFTVTVR